MPKRHTNMENKGANNKEAKKSAENECPSKKLKKSVENARVDDNVCEKTNKNVTETITKKSLSSSINKFTYELYKKIECQFPGNFVCSPMCAHLVLSMAACGARGQTAQEMTKALQLTAAKGIHDYLPEFKKFIQESSREKYDPMYDCIEKLHIANQIFAQQMEDRDILEADFKADMKTYFHSDCTMIDFCQKKMAAQTINNWCSEQTDGKIKGVVTEGNFEKKVNEPPVYMMLLSAIYFKSSWKNVFPIYGASLLPFHINNKETIDVPTMNQCESFHYKEVIDFNAVIVSMRYEIPGFYMLIIMPNDGIDGIKRMEHNLSFLNFNINDLPSVMCDLFLPKFKVENDLDLNGSLKKLGMTTMFMAEKANFEGIAKNVSPSLYADQVFQKCFIDVNERGTEAAAFTYVKMRGGGESREPIKVDINKPFLYMIKDEDNIIFIGRVCNPND